MLCTATSTAGNGTPTMMSAASAVIHVYDEATGAPVTVILRPGKTPSGVEVRKLLSRLIGRIRRHWPNTCITIRGDGHYGREGGDRRWCETYGIDYIFGPSAVMWVLDRLVEAAADDIRVRRPRARPRFCAALPRRATRPSRGTRSGGSQPGSRPAPATPMTCCAEAAYL